MKLAIRSVRIYPEIGNPKLSLYDSASFLALSTTTIPSGSLPDIAIPICFSILKIRLLESYTYRGDLLIFSAAKITPSAQTRPTTVSEFSIAFYAYSI